MRNTSVKSGGSASEFLVTTKDTRLELRTSSDIKEKLRSASLLAGVDMTAFILMAATQKAQELIDHQHLRSLNETAWNNLNEMIMSPRRPSEKLERLMTGKPRYVRRRSVSC